MLLFVLLQFRVPRGRPSPPGDGQAGEDRLPLALHDGGGPDAGVVPPPGDGGMIENAVKETFSLSLPSSTLDWQQPKKRPLVKRPSMRLSQTSGFRLSSTGDQAEKGTKPHSWA